MQSTEGRLGLGLGLGLWLVRVRVRSRVRIRIRVSDPRWIASSAHQDCRLEIASLYVMFLTWPSLFYFYAIFIRIKLSLFEGYSVGFMDYYYQQFYALQLRKCQALSATHF